MQARGDIAAHGAERYVLGSCLVDNEALVRCVDLLGERPEVFDAEPHRVVWAALAKMAAAGEPADIGTVEAAMRADTHGRLVLTAAPSLLTDLAAEVPTPANAGHYARIVSDRARRRRLREAALAVARSADDVSQDLDAALVALRAELDAANDRSAPASGRDLAAAADFDAQEEAAGELPAGVDLGFAPLTRVVGRIPRGRLLIVSASESSQGKTSFALQASGFVAASGGRALVCSVEMDAQSGGERLVTQFTGLALRAPRALREDDWHAVAASLTEIPEGIWVDTDCRTTDEVCVRARRWAMRLGGLDLLVVDGLHDLQLEQRRGEPLRTALDAAVGALRTLARSLPCVVLLTAQPSIAGAKEDRPPVLSDLRESGAIGQKADVVMFVRRPRKAECVAGRWQCEWWLRKNRNGEVPNEPIRMDFESRWARWRTPLTLPAGRAALDGGQG